MDDILFVPTSLPESLNKDIRYGWECTYWSIREEESTSLSAIDAKQRLIRWLHWYKREIQLLVAVRMHLHVKALTLIWIINQVWTGFEVISIAWLHELHKLHDLHNTIARFRRYVHLLHNTVLWALLSALISLCLSHLSHQGSHSFFNIRLHFVVYVGSRHSRGFKEWNFPSFAQFLITRWRWWIQEITRDKYLKAVN